MSQLSLLKSSAALRPRFRAKAKTMVTALNLHFAGAALLALLNLYLVVHLFFAWRETQNNNGDALAAQRIQMKTAEVAAQPLRGLDMKLETATETADRFSERRLPYAYSQVVAELGVLKSKDDVKLTRVQYAPAPALAGTAHELTEVRMDASLSGDYRPLVEFVNSLERDKSFFLIEDMTFTGQQSGTVNLRLRLTTYLRPPIGDEQTKNVAETPSAEAGAGMPAGMRMQGGPGR